GRSAALDLDRALCGAVAGVVAQAQAVQNPPDRRLVARVHGVPDRARDDEPLLRTRHRDVVETETLGLLRMLPLLLDVLVGDRAHPGSRRGMRHLEPEAPVRERENVGDGRTAS